MTPRRFGLSGLGGFSAEAVPEPVAEPLIGHRTFLMHTFGKDPTGPVPLAGTLAYPGDHVIGALHGIFQRHYRWGRGTNVAQCMVRPSMPSLFTQEMRDDWNAHLEEHAQGLPRACTCGFWAYSSPDTTTSRATPIWAAIHAWGRIVVGPEGFRAEKARIIAIVFPHPPEAIVTAINAFQGRYPMQGDRVTTDRDELRAALAINYPNVELMETYADLLAKYPPTDLSKFLAPDKENEE